MIRLAIEIVKTGILGMDEILHGGIPRRNVVLSSEELEPENRYLHSNFSTMDYSKESQEF